MAVSPRIAILACVAIMIECSITLVSGCGQLVCPPEVPLYPFVSSCGPTPRLDPIRALPPLILRPTNGPLVLLPAPPMPPPTVIGNKCICSKTVVKPQLFQRVIQVQKNQRFLKRMYTPVVEKIPYVAKPRC